jgi:hypothetical protein
MQNKQLWYTRRGNEVRGPFPAGQITRYILLGRIRETDELSADQHTWQPVSQIPVLIPEEMKADLNDAEAYERLMIARMREDERGARDRRGAPEPTPTEPASTEERRRASDRRDDEEQEIIRHREVKTAIAEALQHKKHNYFLRGVLATLVLVGIIAGAWYYQPWQTEESSDCNAAPQPWVNWSNCLMEGAKLAAMDLRGARMRNANLAGADLRGAQLGSADLAYTSMAGAQLATAKLNQAVLLGANLRNADLSRADLSAANLAYAVMQGADLSGANLKGADLTNADLQGAKLKGADLSAAKLAQTIWVDGTICGPTSVGNCAK